MYHDLWLTEMSSLTPTLDRWETRPEEVKGLPHTASSPLEPNGVDL